VKKELLFEIGTEELPSRFISDALGAMEELLARELESSRVVVERLGSMGTPRRLTLWGELEEQQLPLETERMGPPQNVAFDTEGNPTKAAEGFAKREGTTVEALEIVETEKGAYVCVRKREEGRRTEEILPGVLSRLVPGIPFPKSMRWADLDVRFARPVHWIVALYDGNVIPFSFGTVVSGRMTRGHRFLHPDPIAVDGPEDYVTRLGQAWVIVDPGERRRRIEEGIGTAAGKVGGTCLGNDSLMEEVTHLVEYPVPALGAFDEAFLELPEEVLITVMEHHQKYFPVVNAAGKLAPYFVAVVNMESDDMDVIRRGNERVLRARLADARFFFEEDRKVSLAERVEELKQVIFQARLGTSYEKVKRFQTLALVLAERVGYGNRELVNRAAYLCKADLVTEMVGEFPELQGVMGREYAIRAGEDEEVAQAIFEHYLPRFAGDELPNTTAGDLISIADKTDTVVGCFGIGLIPSGTSDPFALRRQALGITHIILSKGYHVSLQWLIDTSLGLLEEKLARPKNKIAQEVVGFFKGRFINLMGTEGYPGDLVDAVVNVQMDDMVDAHARIAALVRFRERPEFEPLAVAFKRVANILKAGIPARDADPALFETNHEKAVYARYLELKDQFQALVVRGDYEEALVALATLRGAVDGFFDHVLVMAGDPSIRENRLALLGGLHSLFSQIADFSCVRVGEVR
jgi:glycyl-tRNA synthetase beta chain